MMYKDKFISHGNEKKNRKTYCRIMEPKKKKKIKKENQLRGENVLRKACRMRMEFYYLASTCNLAET